jgi:hypothetical protein
VIDWCNGEGRLQNLALEGWKECILSLRRHFENLSFIHSYRQFNKLADELSKKALLDKDHFGQIVYTRWRDNVPDITQLIKVF